MSPVERAVLEDLRTTIRSAAPSASELILYKMPVFELRGPLVGLAAQQNYLGFYVMSAPAVSRFARELAEYNVGKGCIRFLPSAPLPPSLVTRLVKARVAENLAAPERRLA
ncbi:MAG: DUF1801 domain-containing protein [Thermoplasmata archaeon]|nr:DUF1801 domain-containing protein [Thermoplasmata archaeon]